MSIISNSRNTKCLWLFSSTIILMKKWIVQEFGPICTSNIFLDNRTYSLCHLGQCWWTIFWRWFTVLVCILFCFFHTWNPHAKKPRENVMMLASQILSRFLLSDTRSVHESRSLIPLPLICQDIFNKPEPRTVNFVVHRQKDRCQPLKSPESTCLHV